MYDGGDFLLTGLLLASVGVIAVVAIIVTWPAKAEQLRPRLTDEEVRRRFPAVAERMKWRAPR